MIPTPERDCAIDSNLERTTVLCGDNPDDIPLIRFTHDNGFGEGMKVVVQCRYQSGHLGQRSNRGIVVLRVGNLVATHQLDCHRDHLTGDRRRESTGRSHPPIAAGGR
nr:hypothetical protein [Nocardia paucivorans]